MIRRIGRRLRRIWRLNTDPVGFARGEGVSVGDECEFLNLSGDTFGSEPFLISIGNRVTLSGPVRFLTHDGGVRVLADEHPTIDVVAPIRVNDGAFIGVNVIILPGVSIGARAVVGAGAVVTKDVPAGTVVAGNPARVVRTREEYASSALQKSLGTRGMKPAQKRRIYLKRFRADCGPLC